MAGINILTMDFLLGTLFVTSMFHIVIEGIQDVCMAKTFKAECNYGDVIVMETALYGRMETGTCLKTGSEDIGCTNDVIGHFDKWCSGKDKCELVPVVELRKVKDEWCGDLFSYLRAAYSCMRVIQMDPGHCSSAGKATLEQSEGFLASDVTDQTGCGSPSAPWVIQAKPGQTINISLLDFSTSSREQLQGATCDPLLATIVEKSLATNHSVCGGLKRKRHVYHSKSNSVEIQINPRRNPEYKFILHYQIHGCSDLTPPAHAWYERNDNEATIGCDFSERVWHLQCVDNAWRGVVGNCSTPTKRDKEPETPRREKTVDIPMYTLMMLMAIISTTLFLSLFILCVGIYYIRRYRRRRVERELPTALQVYRKAASMEAAAQMTINSHYRPVSSICSDCHGSLPSRGRRQSQPATSPRTAPASYAHIWERPLPDPQHKRLSSADGAYLSPQTTDSMRSHPPGGTIDTQTTSLLEEDNTSSYYSPETGHKYYVLDKPQPSS